MKRTFKLICATVLSGLSIAAAHAGLAQQVKSSFVYSTYAKTQYPIVFTHGMAGFNQLGNDALGVDYFYQILPDLARNGANVWATRVSPFNSNEVRGEQLVQQVEEILAITGKAKLNMIGHSQGGPTIRYVAGIMPSKIASITTVGSPHKGSPMADIIMKIDGTPLAGAAGIVNLLSAGITWAEGLNPTTFPHDTMGTGRSLSTQGAAQFNAKFPLGMPTTACGEGKYYDKGIYMYSFAGTSPVTNILDPFDLAFAGTSLFMNEANDGVVGRCSSKFGRTINDNLNWNHADEVNHLFGLKSWFAPDPVSIYRQQVNRLKSQGL